MDWVVDIFAKNSALVIRDQTMSPDAQLAFITNFGEPQVLDSPYNLARQTAISDLSNRVIDGKPLGAHNDGLGWHTDLSFQERPASWAGLAIGKKGRPPSITRSFASSTGGSRSQASMCRAWAGGRRALSCHPSTPSAACTSG